MDTRIGRYLYGRRNSRYCYFRMVVPEDVRSVVGHREIRRSLATENVAEAQAVAIQLGERASQLFARIRTMALSDQRIREIAQDAFHSFLSCDERSRACGAGVATDDRVAWELNNYLWGYLETLNAALCENDTVTGAIETDRLIAKLALDVEKGSDDYHLLRRELIKARAEAVEVIIDRANGVYPNDYDGAYLRTRPVRSGVQPNWLKKEEHQPASESPRFSEALTCLLTDSKYKEKERQDVERVCTLFILWFDDRPISEYSRMDIREFRDGVLSRLPARYHVDESRTKSDISKALSSQGARLGKGRIKKLLEMVGRVFGKAVAEEWIQRSPADGVKVVRKEAEVLHFTPYNDDQLRRMCTAIYLWSTTSAWFRHWQFWIPVIALYQGMRCNEIAQLLVTDVVDKDGMLGFDINASQSEVTGKSVKNVASLRFLPAHPTLIDLGFREFWERRKKRSKSGSRTRLWQGLKLRRGQNWSHDVSKWFNRTFKPKFLTPEELAENAAHRKKYAFHSLRATFCVYAREQARMAEGVTFELVGHEDATTTAVHRIYTGRYTLNRLREELDKLDYGIDLAPLYRAAQRTLRK